MTFAQFPTLSEAVRQRLLALQAQRTALLAQAETHLRQDPRAVATWLFGSLGRGDEDELSDIDLFVVVADADHPTLVAERYALMAQLGEPLLVLEAPQNWPPGGVYNMAIYPGSAGPLQVDWYWVRQSAAALPTETRLLFERVNLPRLGAPTWFDYAPVPPRPPAEIATQEVNLFWVMLLIGAKYLARLPNEQVIKPPLASLAHAADFAGVPRSALPEAQADKNDPLARLELLRILAGSMAAIMPGVAARGGRIPAAIEPVAHHYLALIEALVRAQRG